MHQHPCSHVLIHYSSLALSDYDGEVTRPWQNLEVKVELFPIDSDFCSRDALLLDTHLELSRCASFVKSIPGRSHAATGRALHHGAASRVSLPASDAHVAPCEAAIADVIIRAVQRSGSMH